MTVPSLGLAQGQDRVTQPTVPQTSVRDLSDIGTILARVVTWVTGLFFVAAILFLFYAAYLYLTASYILLVKLREKP